VLREGILTYNEDTAQLEVYDGTAFVPAGAEPPAGIGSNVVQTVKTDTFSASTTSTGSAEVTGLTATITPTSASSKILVLYSVNMGKNDVIAAAYVILNRGATAIGIGDAVGTRGRASAGSFNTGAETHQAVAGMVLDSPGTDVAVTYSIRVTHGRGVSADTVYVNRSPTYPDSVGIFTTASTLTLIEVAV